MNNSLTSTDTRCSGSLNVALGFAGLILAALGGLALGVTFDRFAVRDGDHVLSLVRCYLREGHSHGMLIALYNLILGLGLTGWVRSPAARRVASVGAALGFLLPVGLVLRALVGPALAPVGMIGALGLLVSFCVSAFFALRKLCPRHGAE